MSISNIDRHRARYTDAVERPTADTRAEYRSGRSLEVSSELRRRMPDRSATDFESGLDHWAKAGAGGTSDSADAAPPRPAKQRRSKLPQAERQCIAWDVVGGGDREALKELRAELPEKEYRAEAVRRIVRAKAEKDIALDLEDLGLKSLPESIGDLHRLGILNASFNRLVSLPEGVGKLAGLKVLNAAINDIRRVPPQIFGLDKLVHLDLSGNNLRDVSGVGQLVNLTRLHLDYNRIEVLPAELGRLGRLNTFSASMNLFSSVPPEMGDLRQMRRVNLSNTQIATLPVKWHPMIENLVQLDLSRTNFRGFYEDSNVDSPNNMKLPKNMQLLNLSHTYVKTLPENFGTLTFWGDASNNVLCTTNKKIFSKEMKIWVEQTNLPAELKKEGRMATKQLIPKLERVRHDRKRPPTENQDNDVDSGSDDGEDIEYELEYVGAVGAADVVHAERMRARAENSLPRGRAAEWAEACADREFADPWAPAQPQTISANPWGDQPVAPWPGYSQPAAASLPPWAITPTQPQNGYGWLPLQANPVVNPLPYPSPWMMGAGQFNPNPFMQVPGAMPAAMRPFGSYAFTQSPGGMPAALAQYNPTAFPRAPNAMAAPPLHNPYAFAQTPVALLSAAGMQAPPAQSGWLTPQRPPWAPPLTLMERTGLQALVNRIGSLSAVEGLNDMLRGPGGLE